MLVVVDPYARGAAPARLDGPHQQLTPAAAEVEHVHAQAEALRGHLAAASAARSSTLTPSADIHVSYDPSAWHGYLFYPQYGADNLRRATQMRSYVA